MWTPSITRMQLIASLPLTRLLITGGAGFVGSNLAVSLASRHPDWEVLVLDNLYRRGSELNLPRLEEAGVRFVRGDVREPGDLQALPEDRKSTRLNSSHPSTSYAVFCLKKNTPN